MEISTIVSVGALVISGATFILNRRDKAVTETKETNMGLINFRLDQLDKNVQRILDKLETYEKETDEKIEKAIRQHEQVYHNKGD